MVYYGRALGWLPRGGVDPLGECKFIFWAPVEMRYGFVYMLIRVNSVLARKRGTTRSYIA
jgi:hypothetical protein